MTTLEIIKLSATKTARIQQTASGFKATILQDTDVLDTKEAAKFTTVKNWAIKW